MLNASTTERPMRTVRIGALKDQGQEADLDASSPAERLSMMWQLALDAWAFLGEPVAEPRLPRHLVRVLRRQG